MEQVTRKITWFALALQSLKSAIDLYQRYSKRPADDSSFEHTLLVLGLRDSMIQRFEYCTDMLWKVLKVFLEDVEKITLTTFSPRSIIREAIQARILSEDEEAMCVDMIKKRNESSHTYLKEVAEKIAEKIPDYYELMDDIVQCLSTRLKGII